MIKKLETTTVLKTMNIGITCLFNTTNNKCTIIDYVNNELKGNNYCHKEIRLSMVDDDWVYKIDWNKLNSSDNLIHFSDFDKACVNVRNKVIEILLERKVAERNFKFNDDVLLFFSATNLDMLDHAFYNRILIIGI